MLVRKQYVNLTQDETEDEFADAAVTKNGKAGKKNASGLLVFVGVFFVLGIGFAMLMSRHSFVTPLPVRDDLNDGTYQLVKIPPVLTSNDSFSGDDPRLYELFRENLQDRATTHLGYPSKGYVNLNTYNKRMERRRKRMAALDEVRVKYCGPITDEYLEAQRKGKTGHPSTRWVGVMNRKSLSRIRYRYSNDTISYVDKSSGTRKKQIRDTFRSFCSAPHPDLPDTTISIERQGPFFGTGSLDWTQIQFVDDVANVASEFTNKTIYVIGTFFGTVLRDGSVIDYPPLHIHHAHVHPYRRMGERIHVKSMPFENIEHHVMIQTHGDGGCKSKLGGADCNLHQLPNGQGYRVVDSSGFNVNYEINDVRPTGSDPLEYYVDIVIMWTEEKRIETTFMQIGSPIFGHGWMTYMLPLDSNSNFAYWKHKNSWLGPGEISNFITHTHMSLTDSLYVFKGNKAFDYLEKYRHDKLKGLVPYVFDCHNTTMEIGKNDILGVVVASGAELVCEATRPSLQLFCDEEQHDCVYRDSRVEFNCKEKVRLEKDEELVIIAFNKVRNTSTVPLTRQSPINNLLYVSTFGEGYVAHQHSFFRFDFVSDRANTGMMGKSSGNADRDFATNSYAPPALFLYSLFPDDSYKFINDGISDGHKLKENMIEGCSSFNYDVDL
uniref:Uncharacterized protein n=2 Tax=Aplanochytrium stocchinoi TaxID=215587 RepID=A0A6S8BB04_9STRA|eukprot:CAMPEP_0204864210 /NCGR_PEP_ID=MMETSP1348-20121228/3898_1 /ASSEMBLY_ACC=CAM_ASM_000700 /TAXON_ID=215587 /ORGANISM="Aplanochytrium stocchinoi, Strain GSBS06" /LENGTH=662 /DNA_ID=CAMNT_0052014773 /DNA_START=244 /DNA_END=2232 /DNA_ORIENTATION=+